MTEGRSKGKQPTTGCQNKGRMSRGEKTRSNGSVERERERNDTPEVLYEELICKYIEYIECCCTSQACASGLRKAGGGLKGE